MLRLMFRAWGWLRPKAKWLLLALVTVCTLGLVARRRRPQKQVPDAKTDAALAEALRPGLARRADDARREAEEHRAFAERRIEEAQREAERIKTLPPSEVLKESSAYARKVRQRRSKCLLVVLAVLWTPSVLHAQTALPYQLRDPSTGERGWYIPDDVWRAALADAAELEELRAALPRFRQALAARELEAEGLRRSVEFEQAVSAVTTVKLAASNEQLKRAGRWYRSPKSLVPLGLVLGASCVLVPALVVL